MESWSDVISKSPQRRWKDHPSFSSTLLDAIYRSIDEMDGGLATDQHRDSGRQDPYSSGKKQSEACSINGRNPPMTQSEVSRFSREYWSRRSPSTLTRSGREQWSAIVATSSSSDVSSYSGFSSSEAESVTVSHPSRLRPIRTSAISSSTFPARLGRSRASSTSPPPVAFGDEKKGKERHDSVRSRLMRELRKGRASVSPGARLANFLNSLFTAKSKISGDAIGSREESACSTTSSYSRSCLSTMSSSRGENASCKRTVRFCTAGVIVDDNCRRCGDKFVVGREPTPLEPSPVRKVTGLLRRTKMDEEEDGESDSSSDLFELDNLADVGRFQDELPVYRTTSIASYRDISHGLLM